MRQRIFELCRELDQCRSKASGVLADELRRAAEHDPEWVLDEICDVLKV